ncbi:MAG TPA: prepilin-type N-terminal cleavage/methylation domain-containing protein, partial [Candidatus Polarisedimenticolia bacterium]|nr:prepilin-type N-terminal cleavage/methylation domain-containing protein [Candidatus Polarisedimenticolia bacterium]
MVINLSYRANAPRKSRRGLTMIEMMVTMGIFALAMMAFMYAYIFGLKQDELVQSKLGASEESRRSFEKVAHDIRCANSEEIGNYDGTAFTANVNGTNMVGNAIRIFLNATNNNS